MRLEKKTWIVASEGYYNQGVREELRRKSLLSISTTEGKEI